MELPVKFKEQMKELLQEEYGDYLNSFDHDRYYGLRVNTLKISVEEFLKISPFKLKPIPELLRAGVQLLLLSGRDWRMSAGGAAKRAGVLG